MKKWTSPSPYFSEKSKWAWSYCTGKWCFQQGFQWRCVQYCGKKNAKLSGWWRASKRLPSGPPLLLAACPEVAFLRCMGRSPKGNLNHLLLDSVPERSNLSGGERKDDLSQLAQSRLTWTWLVQDENGTDPWEAQWNYHPGLMVAARSYVGFFTQVCIHSSAASSALPGPLLRLPQTWGLHTSHQGAQP